MTGLGLLFALYFVLFHIIKFMAIQFPAYWVPMEKKCLLHTSLTMRWLLHQIIFGYCTCFLNSSGRRTKNYFGNVMQKDFVRLELKSITQIQSWWKTAGYVWYTRKTLKISTALWVSVATTASFLMRAWKSPWIYGPW